MVDALNSTEFDTALGKFRFDAKGDPNLPPYVFYRWGKKSYEQIESKPKSRRELRRHEQHRTS